MITNHSIIKIDHLINSNDHVIVFQKVRDIYGAESAQMTYAKESLNALWEGLMQLADKNKDEVIQLVRC